MIIDFFRQLLTLFLILFLGFSFLNLFNLKVSFVEKISSGFMLGIGLTTFGLFLLGFVGYGFNYVNVLIFLLLVNFVFVIVNKLFRRPYSLPSFSEIKEYILGLNIVEKICLAGVLFFILTSFIQNLYWPIWMWDAVQLYDYRAKLIVGSQGVFFPVRTFYDVSYPLLTSILHSILYVSGSTNPQYIYTLVFVCLIGLVYSFVKENSSRLMAFAASFFVSFYPLFYSFSTQPLTNIVHSTYIVSALFYILRWLESKNKSFLILSGSLFSFSMFTRNEPLWIFTAVLTFFLLLIFRKKESLSSFFNFIVFFIVPNLLVVYVYGRYLLRFNFSEMPTYSSFLGKILQNLREVNIFIVFWDSWVMVYEGMLSGLLVLFVVLFLMMIFVRKYKTDKMILKSLALFSVGYIVFFWIGALFYRIMYSYSEFRALEGSLDRLTIFWKILAFVFFAIAFEDLLLMMRGKNEHYEK